MFFSGRDDRDDQERRKVWDSHVCCLTDFIAVLKKVFFIVRRKRNLPYDESLGCTISNVMKMDARMNEKL